MKEIQCFQDFQNSLFNNLSSLLAHNKLHHAVLFYNMADSPDYTKLLNSLGQLITSNSNEYNPDLIFCNEHIDSNSIIPVDSIRKIIDFVYKSSHQNPNRVVVIPKIENFNNASANAFLKILEEPPKNVYFILSCSNLKNIMPTVRSRCYKIKAPTFSENRQFNEELYNSLCVELLNLNQINIVKISENIEKNKFEHEVILFEMLNILNDIMKLKLCKEIKEGINLKYFNNTETKKIIEKFNFDKLVIVIDKIKHDLRFLHNNLQLNKRSSIEGILFNLC